REIIGESYPRDARTPGKLLADSLNNQAASLWELGEREEAERRWQKAREVDPIHPEATFNQGLLHWRAGLLSADELLRRLHQVQTAVQNSWRPRYMLAQVHAEQRDYDAVLNELEGIQAPEEMVTEVQVLQGWS